jgi:CBS domain containing-hemolysin-like protein
MEVIILTGIVCAFLLNGFIAGTEAAFLSANRLPVELKKKQGSRSGRIISDLLDEQSRFMFSLLTGFVISLVVYGLLMREFLAGAWAWTESHIAEQARPFIPYIRILFDAVLSSAIILAFIFFCRAVFKSRSDRTLLLTAHLVGLLHRILAPLSNLLRKTSEWLLVYLFNVKVTPGRETVTRVDLRQFVQQSKESSESNPDLNTELFEAALSLPSVRIRQCLVPRNEIEAVAIDAGMEELHRRFVDTKLSKLVVHDGNIDNILGYVHQLALFKKPNDIRSILLPIPAVPESMSATDLIARFTRERKSIAWVVDEFGGTAGIITMEDLLEEIFGEIKDEYDTEVFIEQQLAEKEFIFAGRLELDYLNGKYGFDLPVTDSETLSGFIITHHEAIPEQRERIIIDDYEFEVLNVSDTRIETVKMKLLA